MSRYLKLFTVVIIGGSSIAMIAAAPPKEDLAQSLPNTPRAGLALRSNIQANAALSKIAPKIIAKDNSEKQALARLETTVCSHMAALQRSATANDAPQSMDYTQSLEPQNLSRAQLEQHIREALIRN